MARASRPGDEQDVIARFQKIHAAVPRPPHGAQQARGYRVACMGMLALVASEVGPDEGIETLSRNKTPRGDPREACSLQLRHQLRRFGKPSAAGGHCPPKVQNCCG